VRRLGGTLGIEISVVVVVGDEEYDGAYMPFLPSDSMLRKHHSKTT
jgi:hypothetical protein